MDKIQKIGGLFIIILFTWFEIAAQHITDYTIKNEPAIRPDLLFERFGSRNNLPDNRIRSIFQDSQGVLWIGTMNGVCQYDGNNFKKDLNTKDPFRKSGSWTSDICEDSLQNIWFGTNDGLNVYSTISQEFISYTNDPKNPASIIDNKIKSLLYDQHQNLWIGTVKGLLRYDPLTRQFIAFNQYPLNTKIEKIIRSYDDYIWIACYDGVVHYNVINGKFDFYRKEFKANAYGDRIWSILEINQNLLIGTGGEGLSQLSYDNDLNKYSKFKKIDFALDNSDIKPIIEVFDICMSNTGDTWLGTDRGLVKVQNIMSTEMKVSLYTTNPTNELSLSNNHVYKVYIDQTEVLWCGTEVGLCKLDLALLPIKFYSIIGQNDKDPVRSIYSTDDRVIWIGTADNGLYQFNQETMRTTSIHFTKEKTSLNAIRSIIKWKDRVWIGTLGGAYSINPDNLNLSIRIELENIAVFAFLSDSRNNLWIGTNHGLYKEDSSGKRILYSNDPNNKSSIGSNFARSIYEDHSGKIWIGFDNGGINYFSPQTGNFYRIPEGKDGQKVYGSTVLSIIEYPENTIWVGSEIALNKIVIVKDSLQGEKLSEIKNYFEEDGLVDKAINGILKDDNGYLWISTINGFARFNIKNETFENFLPNIKFAQGSFFNRNNQKLYFGGAEGFIEYNPREITNNQYLPKVVINELRLFNQPVMINEKYNNQIVLKKAISKTEQITLNYKNNVFTLGFTSLHFANPAKNQYSYKLEGFDERWINTDANNRFATYTNLNSGDYTFQVKAANNSGGWTDTATTIKIKILPPPWKTWYAILGYCVLFGIVLFAFTRSVLIYFRQNNQIILDRLEKDRLNSLYQMKMQFFTDISHEFRTPLSLIVGPVDDILDEQSLSENVKSKAIMIKRNCKSMLNLIDELMTFRKIDLGRIELKATHADLVNFINEIIQTFRPLADRKEICIKYIAPGKIENIWFDQNMMEKIMNNLISNALKNTPKNGKIVVSVEIANEDDLIENTSSDKSFVIIKVEDTGCGIEAKDINSIFNIFFQTRVNKDGTGVGLALTKNLVELHKGSISVCSTPSVGTCFKVLIPMGKDHFDKTQIIDDSGSNHSFVLEKDNIIFYDEAEIKTSVWGEAKTREKPVLLVVEDNLEVNRYVVHLFDESYIVINAGNGLKALELIAAEHPDVVISDIMMPEMDGIELCQKIKTNFETCHIPVILLTAKTTYENIVEGTKVGADLYIPKPFHPELLKLQVENLILSRKQNIRKFLTGGLLIPRDITKNPMDEEFIERIINIVKKNIDNDNFSVEELGVITGMSRSNLFRKLKALSGQTPIEFIYFIRLKRSMELLLERKMNVAEIAYAVGFKNPSSFSKSFKKQFGKSPLIFLHQIIRK
jgi:signal transduction histidine kinase/ligand-binding sensor domain-containing protein/DNA-binding response OmpR family regulator